MCPPLVSVTLTDDQWREVEQVLKLSHRRDMRDIANVIRLRGIDAR